MSNALKWIVRMLALVVVGFVTVAVGLILKDAIQDHKFHNPKGQSNMKDKR